MVAFILGIFGSTIATTSQILPTRELTNDDFQSVRERIHWNSLLPDGVGHRTVKKLVRVDWPADPIDSAIDNLPVELRIVALEKLTQVTRRKNTGRILEHRPPEIAAADFEIYKNYIAHNLGNTIIEVGVLKEFLEHIFSKSDTRFIRATALVAHLRKYGKHELNKYLDFITPLTLIDWSRSIREPREFRAEMERTNSYTFIKNPHGSLRSLIYLERATWTNLFRNRLNRLVVTGYEYID